MKQAALIVDDDRTERRLMIKALKNYKNIGFQEAENGREALIALKATAQPFQFVVLDLDMPVMDGMEALKIIHTEYPHIPVIIATGFDDTKTAVEAMKLGAADFISKPVDPTRLNVCIRNALKFSSMSQEILNLKRRATDTMLFSDLIGHNTGLNDNIHIGKKAAACDLPVLISGETGTGKEVFARAIHGESRRSSFPFIAINCGAIPENLVESTLFGHEKGSFTGAIHKSPGKFQEAGKGTIFLDEIGELPLDAQVKLLRVLQQQEVEPVGAAKPVKVDVRVISATNRDLASEVKEGRFREDLYFRLNVLLIDLPPLRARTQDIRILASYFMHRFCAAHKIPLLEITDSALSKLEKHNWPGNVRELENVINRALALCEGKDLKAQDLSFAQATNTIIGNKTGGYIELLHADGTFKSFRELERIIISMALEHHGHNISKTARVLGMAKSTLYSKIETLADLKSA